MFALAWQDDDVRSELLLQMKAFIACGSLTLVEHIPERLRYRSVLTSLPDQVSPNARHWCCKTCTTAQSQWLDLHACIHSPFKWNADPIRIVWYDRLRRTSLLPVAGGMYGRTNQASDGMPSLGMTSAISMHDATIVSIACKYQVHHSGCVLTSPRPLSWSNDGHILLNTVSRSPMITKYHCTASRVTSAFKCDLQCQLLLACLTAARHPLCRVDTSCRRNKISLQVFEI